MLLFLGNVSTGESISFLIMMLFILIPFFLVCWLLIEVIRWLRRK